jgi:ketosteroid isomerase-like protein
MPRGLEAPQVRSVDGVAVSPASDWLYYVERAAQAPWRAIAAAVRPQGPLSVLLAVGLLGANSARAMTADEKTVAKRLEAFRAAQFAADAKALDGLCAVELSYSHSDAHIEDKATFIKNATAGKSKFLSLDYQDPSVRVAGDAAIVRFHWVAESESIPEGKKSSTNLAILMNWQKQDGEWRLLSRASTKLG